MKRNQLAGLGKPPERGWRNSQRLANGIWCEQLNFGHLSIVVKKRLAGD